MDTAKSKLTWRLKNKRRSPKTINSFKGTEMKQAEDNKTLELPLDFVEPEAKQSVNTTGATSGQHNHTQTTVAKGYQAWPQLPVPESVDPLLVSILSWPRKHNTQSEQAFASWLVKQLQVMGMTPVYRAGGAITVELRGPKGMGTTLFSSHIDTVDCEVADVNARKKLVYDANFGAISLDKTNTVGSCLGADDGIGVWLMLKMIEAKVPGGYIFNRGEEVGGVSAKAMAQKDSDWLKKFQVAVSFDRPRDNEVITHQRGGTECASQKFALALSAALNKRNDAFEYKPSKAGVYTDTYDWRGIIPECVNLGVGYTSQHGVQETQDYAHAVALLDAIKDIDWEALPVDREAKIEAYVAPSYGGSGWDTWKNKDYDSFGKTKNAKPKLPPPYVPPVEPDEPDFDNLYIEDDILSLGDVDDVAYWMEGDVNAAANAVVLALAELKGLRAEVKALRSVFKRSI